jgi:beta-glucosidase
VERFAKAINAGIDQIGGEDDPQPIIDAVQQGLVSMARIDDAVGRILLQTFRLGLFDAPFVDGARAAEIVGCDEFRAAGAAAQRSALCILTASRAPMVTTSDVVYTDGIDAAAFTAQGIATTERFDDATVGVIRVDAPHQVLHPEFFFGRMQHEGDLDFKADDPVTQRLQALCAAVPTVVIAHLDRPAVLTDVVERAAAVIGEFGASDDAIADVLTGAATATGRLPFRLPTSMDSALAQPCDRPDPSIASLFDVFHRAEHG